MPHRPLSDFVPTEQIRQMAHTTRRYSGPSALAFSPDGRTLAYVSDRSGTYCAWTIPVAGGQPSLALAVDGGAVRSLCWSASGDLIGAVDRGGTERWQLYVTRSDERIEPLATSDGDAVQHLLSWNAASPDGRFLAISSNARERSDVDLVVVDTKTKEQRTLMIGPYWHVAGGWSPDGRSLLVMRVNDNTDQTLFFVDAASGDATELTPHPADRDVQNVPAGWDARGRALAMSDAGREHLALVALDRDGTRTPVDEPDWDVELAVSSVDGRVQVWSVNVDGYSTLRWRRDGGDVRERELDGGVCEDLVVSADGSLAAYLRQSPVEPSQVWVLDTRSGEARQVVTTRTPIDPAELVRPELVRIPGPDGPIPAFIYRPKNMKGRVPALLYPHGGPEGQSRPAYNHVLGPLQALVQRGIAVVVPNIHGSTGYGRSWQIAIHKDWGGVDLRDLRAVADWMAKEPRFDPDRLAVYGGSYGGFATLLCVTQIPDRWRCAVDLFGVANLVTMIETNQPNWQRFLRRWIGDLETDRAKLVERSPITHIDKVRCPMLVLQGANDPRVPKSESDQVVERLRARGQRVEYVVFPDEGHGFTKRKNQDAAYEKIVDFLTKELVG
ncbi:MAG TPA: S9 family peptidase [Gaiellaceae bacterium]|nr:S9 family peptidase [Gaiellaceae bacterium]